MSRGGQWKMPRGAIVLFSMRFAALFFKTQQN